MWITQLFPLMRIWIHCWYQDLYTIPATHFSIDAGTWPRLQHLTPELVFHTTALGSAIPLQSKLISVRHQQVSSLDDLRAVHLKTDNRIWLRIVDPGFRIPVCLKSLSDNTGAESVSNKLFTTSHPCAYLWKSFRNWPRWQESNWMSVTFQAQLMWSLMTWVHGPLNLRFPMSSQMVKGSAFHCRSYGNVLCLPLFILRNPRFCGTCLQVTSNHLLQWFSLQIRALGVHLAITISPDSCFGGLVAHLVKWFNMNRNDGIRLIWNPADEKEERVTKRFTQMSCEGHVMWIFCV